MPEKKNRHDHIYRFGGPVNREIHKYTIAHICDIKQEVYIVIYPPATISCSK